MRSAASGTRKPRRGRRAAWGSRSSSATSHTSIPRRAGRCGRTTRKRFCGGRRKSTATRGATSRASFPGGRRMRSRTTGTRKCACSSGRGGTTLPAPSLALLLLPGRPHPSPRAENAAVAKTSESPKTTKSMSPSSCSKQPHPAPRLGAETEQSRPLHLRQTPPPIPASPRLQPPLPSPKRRSSPTSTRRSRRARTRSPPLACCSRRALLLALPPRRRTAGDSQAF